MSLQKDSSRAVQKALQSHGLQCRVVEVPSSTRTAGEAAEAIGCSVAQIAKSIVFKAPGSGRAVMVVASGVNRINERIIESTLGESIEKASPEFVREATGFAIGGVPPCGHAQSLTIFIDRELLDFDVLWAAAGTPNAVFQIAADDLVELTGGKIIDVT